MTEPTFFSPAPRKEEAGRNPLGFVMSAVFVSWLVSDWVKTPDGTAWTEELGGDPAHSALATNQASPVDAGEDEAGEVLDLAAWAPAPVESSTPIETFDAAAYLRLPEPKHDDGWLLPFGA
jgi:hypothetical protein